MMSNRTSFLVACSLIAATALLVSPALAQKTISEFGITRDALDYSDAGLDIGNAGFWFANFGQSAPVSGEAVDSNHINQLPSWVLPVFDPNDPAYSFGDFVSSSGGQPNWNMLTLPDGTMGPSGSLVDPETDDNSNNTIPRLVLGADTPPSFLMHVVVDNTNNEHDPANRIRGRAEGDPGFDEDFRYNTSPGDFNGEADVYTFRYDGWDVDDFIKIQLNSGVAGIDAGIAGLMFDVIPEPTSVVLAGLTVLAGLGWRRR